MTTDLAAWLFATIGIEDSAARDLVVLLGEAIGHLDYATGELTISADLEDDDTKRIDWEARADDCQATADSLNEWIGRLNATLMLPPNQREALT